MSSKTETIHIKWIRSGIGFPRKQKEMVRSLGLRRLNQIVERPDTVHIRGLVAKIPHLLEVVEAPSSPAWDAIPEYTIIPSEAPVKPKRSRPERVKQKSEDVPATAVSAGKEEVPEKAASNEGEAAASGKRRSKIRAAVSEEKGTAKAEQRKVSKRRAAGGSAAKVKKSTEPKSSKKGKK